MIKSERLFNRSVQSILLAVILLPGVSQAAVFINEVAWMGSDASANYEWIELYNDGPATAVDGWILSDGRNLSIELAGTVSANSYAVLERTSDESVAGSAFLIYTGALPNTGGTLRLETAQGQLVDLVSGGDGWEQIGGDNTTKETAQYTSKGWITAVATPGALNSTQSTVIKEEKKDVDKEEDKTDATADEPEQTQSSPRSKGSSNAETVRLTLPDVTLDLAIDAQSIGYINQTIPLRAEASGIGKDLLNSLEYQWNFGDGNTGQSADTTHRYQFPGTYIVTLYAQYKRQKQITRHQITILPVELSLSKNANGDIQLNNDSPYEVDISGYTVVAHDTFTFPKYSLILPNQTITLPRTTLTNSNNVMIAVYDTQRLQVATNIPLTTNQFVLANASAQSLATFTSGITNTYTPSRVTYKAPTTPKRVQAPAPEPVEEETTIDSAEFTNSIPPSVSIQASSVTSSPTRTQRLSYVGLAIIILLTLLFTYLTPRRNKGE